MAKTYPKVGTPEYYVDARKTGYLDTGQHDVTKIISRPTPPFTDVAEQKKREKEEAARKEMDGYIDELEIAL